MIKDLKELTDIFQSYLQLQDPDFIPIVVASFLSIRLDSDPVWIFIQGPPGSSKTEVLRSIFSEEAYTLSSLSDTSLISGYKEKDGKDHSLLPELDKKVLIIKDFTDIMGIRADKREKILSDLRDAYDGYSSRKFGWGTKKEFHSQFGIIAGVTDAIEEFMLGSRILGERFLTFKIRITNSINLIRNASRLSNTKSSVRRDLRNVMSSYLDNITINPRISIPEESNNTIIYLSNALATLRTFIERNYHSWDEIKGIVRAEVGTRINVQLSSLYRSLVSIEYPDIIRLIKRIVIDSIPSMRWLILRHLFDSPDESHSTEEFKDEITRRTLSNIFTDLCIMNICKEVSSYPRTVVLSKQGKELCKKLM